MAVEVLVVGGSVGGLAVAGLVQKEEERRRESARAKEEPYEPRYRVRVLEQTKGLRGGGAGVGIRDNVKDILEEVCGGSVAMLPMRHKENRAFVDGRERLLHLCSEHPYSAMYLNDMYASLFDILPEDTVKFSHKVTDCRRGGDGRLVATTLGGSQYEADLVIGADGAASTMRKLFNAGKCMPVLQYRGYCGWRGVLDISAERARGGGSQRVPPAGRLPHLCDGARPPHGALRAGGGAAELAGLR